MADAGWYPDAHDPNQQHYFDGQNWTGQLRPNPAAPTDDTMRRGDLPAEQQWAQPAQQPYQQPNQQPTQQWAQPNQPQAPQQQWGQPPAQPQWAQPGQAEQGPSQWQPGPPPAPSSGSRNRKPLIIAGVAVVAVVAGLVTFLVWPSDDAPSITYEGKSISSPEDTLTAAEKAVDKAVSDRKGAKDGDTRCYFAKPKKPASGAKASDVADSLRCGPVLFIDGVKTSAYMSVPVTATTKGSSVQLEVRDDVNDIEPAALDTSLNLYRPDGKTAPTGNGGAGSLAVPEPPKAAKDLLTTGTLQSTDSIKTIGTKVVGKNLKVTLDKAGVIKRFGEGDDARSAPDGQQLVAFQVSYGSGDVDQSAEGPASLVSAGGTPRSIPDASGDTYVIAAIPTAGASIVLTDGGYSQSLSLPAGQPGANTLAVLQRTNRSTVLTNRIKVPFSLRKGSRTGKITYTASASIAALDYWAPGNTSVHASSPANALLTVRLTYVDTGQTYGFAPSLLKLRVGSRLISARNVAPSGKINNVFEVPASFKAGTLEISGSTVIQGITLKVKTKKSFVISIP